MSPFICSFQDNMSNWMSSLIQQQDGCLQMVAQRDNLGRAQQEQLAHAVAQRAAMPSQNDQVSYLRAQLAHREAQLEQVHAERDNHFTQEEVVLAHTRLLSSEAKDWKSRVVTEADKCYVKRVPKLHNMLPKLKKPWIHSIKLDGDKPKQNSETCVNPTPLKHRLLYPSCMRHNWNTSSSILHKRDSSSLRQKPSGNLNMRNNKHPT